MLHGICDLVFLLVLLFGIFSEVNAETKYCVWLQECYEDTFMRLLSIMSKHKPATQLQALSTMMKLLSLEGKYPVDCGRQEGYYFPTQKLRVSISALSSPYIPLFLLVVRNSPLHFNFPIEYAIGRVQANQEG
jgi:hypothetical protein